MNRRTSASNVDENKAATAIARELKIANVLDISDFNSASVCEEFGDSNNNSTLTPTQIPNSKPNNHHQKLSSTSDANDRDNKIYVKLNIKTAEQTVQPTSPPSAVDCNSNYFKFPSSKTYEFILNNNVPPAKSTTNTTDENVPLTRTSSFFHEQQLNTPPPLSPILTPNSSNKTTILVELPSTTTMPRMNMNLK